MERNFAVSGRELLRCEILQEEPSPLIGPTFGKIFSREHGLSQTLVSRNLLFRSHWIVLSKFRLQRLDVVLNLEHSSKRLPDQANVMPCLRQLNVANLRGNAIEKLRCCAQCPVEYFMLVHLVLS